MIKRDLTEVFRRYLKTFPAVLVTGPRQVGKTTLAQTTLKDKFSYVLLENPDQRLLAQTDPRRFLEHNTPPVIFDEFQHVPELASYLQGIIDANRGKKGQFVLTGSQNFLMMEQVSQSLAGRIGVLTMHGLNSNELPARYLKSGDTNLGFVLFRGSYPELWQDLKIKEVDWYPSYVQTYIERDVRRIINVEDLASFERFIRVCAARTAQTLNYSDIASDTGIGQSTVQRWLSVLETTNLIQIVKPYYTNITSRIKKSPKLYFMDTGLVSYLLRFRSSQSLINSPQYGAVFETLVYSNYIKKQLSKGIVPNHYYMQTKSKVGVDLIIENEQKLTLVEIKGAKTLRPELAEQLIATKKNLKKKVVKCILAGAFDKTQSFEKDGVLIESKRWFEI